MKTTLITGGSSGIGEIFARRFAADNHNLFLVARSEEKLKNLCVELMDKHEITAQYLALDLTEKDADLKIFETTEELGFEIDLLINNAGIGSAGYFSELDLNTELNMLNLNINVLVAITHRYLPQMRKRNNGTIINVSSMAGFQPLPFMAAYSASKTFVRYFSEAIAAENSTFNIHVMTLCPGATDTNFFKAAKIGDRNKKAIGFTQTQTPAEVVDAAIKGLQKKKWIVISGSKNKFVSYLSRTLPNNLISKAIAKRFRSNFDS